MNARTSLTNTKTKIIQPVRKSVPAGFCVFKKGEIPEVFLYVESGELSAIQYSNDKETVAFKVNAREVVGVQTLVEKEPLPYSIVASTDSTYLQIDEECLASALKASPVWLLAATRQIVLQTKRAKKDVKKSLCQNKARTLAEFLSMRANIKKANGEAAIFEDVLELLRECSWLSRISVHDLKDELLSFERRHMVMLLDKNLGVENPELLKVYADYLASLEQGEDFLPFHLNLTEKRCLHRLELEPEGSVLEASAWLSILKDNDKFATVAEIIKFESYGIFQKAEFGLLALNKKVIERFLLCIRREADIRGALQ